MKNLFNLIITVGFVFSLLLSGCKNESVLPETENNDTGKPDETVIDESDESNFETVDEEHDDPAEMKDDEIEEVDFEENDVDEVPDDAFNPSDEPCTVLFGNPSPDTGLGPDMCQPLCNCEGKFFQPPVYTKEMVDKFSGKILKNPLEPLTSDPYDKPGENVPQHDKVCGVILDSEDPEYYSLETYDTVEELEADGAILTHYGACGLCSPLNNLAVYILVGDLTGPVRKCGLDSIIGGEKKNIECLMDIGFDYPCAQIWYYNTSHTRSKCLAVCMSALSDPYHKPDGSLNDCIQCDEDNSGDVFKAVAGRTRRNTGLPAALCRPCYEALPVFHFYE
jgi:hypothetical protein